MLGKFKSLSVVLLSISISVIFSSKSYPDSRDFVKFETAKTSFKKGIKFFNRMQYLAAVEFFRNAIKEYPEYQSARDYLARSYKLAGFTDEALRELENFKDTAPEKLSIANRINTIRYRHSEPGKKFDYSNLLLNDIYHSSDFKMFNFSKPIDIAVDNEKSLYITSFSSGKITIIDTNGKGKSTIRPDYDAKLYGIDYHNGKLIVTNFSSDLVYLLNKKGKITGKFGSSGSGDGQFYGPEGVCFDSKGFIYVVDSGNNRIQKFDEKGRFILKFGEKGEYEGQLMKPADVAELDGIVYVTDTGNKRIAVFDESGNFIKNIFPEGIVSPRGINVYNGILLISDESRGLAFYDPQKGKIKWFTSWEGELRKFSKLMSTTADRDGFIYSLDHNYESVIHFSPMQKAYSNLDVEVTSVDLNQFPVVAFYVNVRGRGGKPVYNLDSINFKITEDRVTIQNPSVNYLRRKDPSVHMVLCVDRSLKNEGYHNDIPWVSDFILKKMRRNDRIKLINFNSKYWIGNRFDWSRRRTIRALRERVHIRDEKGRGKRIYSRGKQMGKVLYNAVSDLVPKLSRRAVVMVTDGSVNEDGFQHYTPDNVIQFARTHYIPIYIISFKKIHPTLHRIARETGGQAIRSNRLDSLRNVYDRVKKTEEYRYILVYSTLKPSSFKGFWSDVRIEVDYKKQKGVEWGGYFVP